MQSEPQDYQHDDDRADGVDHRAFLQGAELIVRHRHRPGQAGARLIGRIKLQLGCRLADRIGCGLAWLKRGKIQHRLDINEVAKLAR